MAIEWDSRVYAGSFGSSVEDRNARLGDLCLNVRKYDDDPLWYWGVTAPSFTAECRAGFIEETAAKAAAERFAMLVVSP
jgi:hypothetical protein